MLTLSPRKLRLVNDPVSQTLTQLHKLVYASQVYLSFNLVSLQKEKKEISIIKLISFFQPFK
jgi:hypothetical protein